MNAVTRRSHRKSRHGCHQCKKNRIKCDEQKPSCSRCLRVGTQCSLLDPASSLIIISNPPSKRRQESANITTRPSPPLSPQTSISSIPNPIVRPVELPANTLNYQSVISNSEVQRMRLITHYLQFTAQSIGDLTLGTHEGRSIWQKSIPGLAFQNDYLMHCVLSIAALHIALTDPLSTNEMSIVAMEHHTQGLSRFTSQLGNISPDNIDALFSFAGLTALYSFGIHLTKETRLSPLAKIHEVFTMISGTCLFVQQGKEWLQNGIWRPWFGNISWTFSQERLSDVLEEVIAKLTARIGTTITTSQHREMYSTAVAALRENFFHASAEIQTQKSLVMLPVAAPKGFTQMVCIAEPLSLAILANWAVILHWMRRHVWLRNWGIETIKAVRDLLTPDWHDCIAWAMQETGCSDDVQQLPTPSESDYV